MTSIVLIAGAPGAGKSSMHRAFLDLGSGHVAFDMDALIQPASWLAGADIRATPQTWPVYNELWLAILESVAANGSVAILFTPIDQTDLMSGGTGGFPVHWLLLDCSDETRRARLVGRQWPATEIDEAVRDAAKMRRQEFETVIDTTDDDPAVAAARLEAWLGGLSDG